MTPWLEESPKSQNNHVLQGQSSLSKKAGKQEKYLRACMWEQEQVPAKLRHKMLVYEWLKQGQVIWYE